jgi:hypothetical protein
MQQLTQELIACRFLLELHQKESAEPGSIQELTPGQALAKVDESEGLTDILIGFSQIPVFFNSISSLRRPLAIDKRSSHSSGAARQAKAGEEHDST